MGGAMKFTVELPMPPSINNSFVNARARGTKRYGPGRIMSDEYRAWRKGAALAIIAQVRADGRVGGPIDVCIDVPERMNGDVDNRIKAVLDALVDSGRIDDDKHVMRVTCAKVAQGVMAIVTVKEWGS